MADKKAPDPKTKRSQTVRERSQTDAAKPKRRVLKTAETVSKPAKAAHKGVKKVLKPLSPLLAPFRLKPVRFVGRWLAKLLLINYFISSFRELKQVTWPNRKETVKLTAAVFMFAIVFGAIIAITDYGLDKIFRKILLS
jgi:preprotein translocase SecE subunit